MLFRTFVGRAVDGGGGLMQSSWICGLTVAKSRLHSLAILVNYCVRLIFVTRLIHSQTVTVRHSNTISCTIYKSGSADITVSYSQRSTAHTLALLKKGFFIPTVATGIYHRNNIRPPPFFAHLVQMLPSQAQGCERVPLLPTNSDLLS